MAPSPMGKPLKTDPPGPPQYCGDHSLTCGRNGCRESAMGSSSNPWRIAQRGHRGLGTDRIATAPATTGSSMRRRQTPMPGWRGKESGKEAKLSYTGHMLMENRNGLAVAVALLPATGTAEREAA